MSCPSPTKRSTGAMRSIAPPRPAHRGPAEADATGAADVRLIAPRPSMNRRSGSATQSPLVMWRALTLHYSWIDAHDTTRQAQARRFTRFGCRFHVTHLIDLRGRVARPHPGQGPHF